MADDWSMEENESPVVVGPELQDIKLFGKWSADEVQVGDISLTVCVYRSLVCISSYNHNILNSYISLVFSGLHCRQGKELCVSSSYCWSLCSQEVQESSGDELLLLKNKCDKILAW